MELIVRRLPDTDPEIKLIPIIKLIGKLTVSPMINLTLLLLELFCIPIIKSKNKAEFKVMVNNTFLNKIIFYLVNYFYFGTNHKLCFS